MSKIFISSILLNEAKFDKDIFIKDFKDEWGIELKEAKEKSDDDSNLVFEIEDTILGIVLIPNKIHNNEAIVHAKTNFRWKDAINAAEEHKAHILVSMINFEITDLVNSSKIYTKIISTLAKVTNAIGIDTLGTVFNPKMYIDFTKYYDDREMFPVENIIFTGFYSNENGKINAYTYGMEIFSKKNIEIINSSESAENIYYFLQGIIDYVITSNVILQDGETIGFSEEQKIKIEESKGVAIDQDGKTLKLHF